MTVRKMSRWMESVDERILERLASEGDGTAFAISLDVDRTRFHVLHRCRVLAEAEFVEREQRGQLEERWAISTWGLLYLAGELDADLRRPVPGMRPGGRIRPGWYAGFG